MAISPKAASAPPSPESVLNKMRSRGLRVSTPRRVVVQTLFAARAALSAHEIAVGLGDSAAQLDLATVYRNLETLEETEIVVRIVGADGAGRWRLADGSGHCYVACHRCGALEEVGAEELDGLRAVLRERFGYEVSFSRFPMMGVCRGCS